MAQTAPFAGTNVPQDRERETLDVSTSPPPKPLTLTLERLAELDEDTVLLQVNDRAPQHLYPKLSERGFEFETVETDDAVLTAIWVP